MQVSFDFNGIEIIFFIIMFILFSIQVFYYLYFYRKPLKYLESEEKYRANMPWYQEQISNCTYRQFTTGFFFGKPSDEAQIYDSNTYIKEYTYLGVVGECNADGLYAIEQRNKFSVVKRIVNEDGEDMPSAPHPKQKLWIDLGQPLDQFDILRRKEED
mgnify:CR=1 FL=1